MSVPTNIYGLLAEFDSPSEIVDAATAARAAGYQKMDAYTPFPVEGLSEAIDFHRTSLPLIIFIGGLLGCLGGFALQYWCAKIDYPINVGGRPLNSWPMFVPVTFELAILCAALSAIIGLFALNGLPMPYHPVFNVPEFALASRNRFFLCLEASDPKFDVEQTYKFLATLNTRGIYEVKP